MCMHTMTASLPVLMHSADLQIQEQQIRQRETALTAAEHKVELLRTRLENDVSTTQKAAQAVEAERAELKVCPHPVIPTDEQSDSACNWRACVRTSPKA